MSSSIAQCCEGMKCNDNYVKFPFRLKDDQPKTCGCRGFDLHCDDELGLLLKLGAADLTVDNIYYSSREIVLSDPNDCLPQKLLNLNITSTPFQGSVIAHYPMYNCSGFDYPFDFSYQRKIDCLSGSNYTVISEEYSLPRSTIPNCTFLKQVSVPTDTAYIHLNSYSSFYLTWDEQDCVSCR
ncbi:putative RING-H2 finger protein ATL21A [Bienertia sinuspersici]